MSHYPTRTRILTATAAILASSSFLPAHAEDSPGATHADTSEPVLAEIIVTAEKREVDLQSAPLSVTAVSGAAMAASHISSPQDLDFYVPGLTVAPNQGDERVIAIRGIGDETSENASSQPSVSYHIDGVYIGSPIALNTDFLDVARVEVLRGPQGTVFGQNSTGGSINVITNDPDTTAFHAGGDVSFGNYDLAEAHGALNIPLSDQFALRIAVSKLDHAGFAKATPINYDLDDESSFNTRLKLLYQATDNLSIILAAQNQVINQHGAAEKNILDPNPDPRELTQDYPSTYYLSSQVYSATIKWSLPWATLKSISSWQHLRHFQQEDNDRLTFALRDPHDLIPYWQDLVRTVTQEFTLTSRSTGALDWILGAFLFDTKQDQQVLEYYATQPYETLDVPATAPTSLSQYPTDLGYELETIPKRLSWSPYAQSTYHLTDALRLTGGLRYSHDQTTQLVSAYYNLFGPASTIRSSGNKLTGKAAVEYDLTSDNLLYASYTRGYKPGGANNNSGGPELVPHTYAAETIDAYEIGSKNEGFERRMRLNVAAFLYNYKNYQFISDDPVPYQGGVVNAPAARIFGTELESQFLLPARFKLDANLSTLTGHFTKSFDALDSVASNAATAAIEAQGFGFFSPQDIAARASAVSDINGNPIPKLPHFATTVALERDFTVGSGDFNTRVEYSYKSDFVYRVFDNSALDRVPSCSLWNLGVAYKPDDSRFTFGAMARNVFDMACVTSRFTNPFGLSATTSQQYVAPRQIMFRAAYAL